LSREFFNHLKSALLKQLKNIKRIGFNPKRSKIISNVSRAKTHFSKIQQLFVISFDPKKQSSCTSKHIFFKTNQFSFRLCGRYA